MPPPTVDSSEGYWLEGQAFVRVGDLFGRNCGYDFCPEGVTVVTARVGSRIVLAVGNSEVTIRGRSLAKIRAAWRAAMPDATDTEATIDGQPAIHALAPNGQQFVFAIYGGRVFAIGGHSIIGDSRAVLSAFLARFHFIVPGCSIAPCRGADDPASDGPSIARVDLTRATGTWATLPNAMDSVVDDVSARTWSVRCSQTCFGQLRIAVGTTATGALVAPGRSGDWFGDPLGRPDERIRGATLEELERCWQDLMGSGTFERISVDGVPATRTFHGAYQHVFLVWRDHVIAITSSGSITFDNAPSAAFTAFAPGFTLIRE